MTDSFGHDEANIVLAGFMATGKTTVGLEVARRLGRPFVDMDAVLEERLGAAIPQVFAKQGEASFRKAESALCQQLSKPQGLVIAAGGGAVLTQANRVLLGRGGLVVCLVCDQAEIMQRLGDVKERPMLAGHDVPQRVTRLLAERAAAYDTIPHQIQTTHRGVDEVAEQVIAAFQERQKRLPVSCGSDSYAIIVGDGVLHDLGALLVRLGFTGRTALITNEVVGPLYAEAVAGRLEEVGLRPEIIEIQDGEKAKTLDTVSRLYDRLAAAGLERRQPVIALGGGVVGDVAGFVAATYLRGVPLVQVPTTVLAMVDSSVGGKVGIDHPRGKNLIGAFKQPIAVVEDLSALMSLPLAERRAGLAEVVKHGIIGDPAIFSHLEAGEYDLAWLIPQALRVKISIVEQDPLEQGRRAELNLGHTFGHALEVLSGYRLRHGEAVAIGLVAATRLAERVGLCEPGLAARVHGVLSGLGLPVSYHGYQPEEVWAAMGSDKKRRGGRLRFVLPVRLGKVIVTDEIPKPVVLDVLRELREDRDNA